MPDLVDLHTHILPELDDGPREQSLSCTMARAWVEDGVTKVFATPHGFSPSYHAHPDTIRKFVAKLSRELSQQGIPLDLQIGMELRYHREMFAHLLRGSAICLGGKTEGPRFLLLEFPTREWPDETNELIYELKYREITPIIAHPERNLVAQRHPDKVAEAVEEGAWMQLTAGSITGEFGPMCQKVSRKWIGGGLVHIVASDAHDPQIRKPGLQVSYDWITNKWGYSNAVARFIQNAEIVWQTSRLG